MHRPSATADHRHRAGLSLLEVLVACGILVVGLTSIAAILPAAGSRLGQATQADRGGVLAANAYAEVMSRSLVAADVFSVNNKACVFGKELGELPTVAGAVTAVASGTLSQRIDPVNGFLLEDDLVYTTGTASDLPVNAFQSAASPIRRFNEGLCWGGMIACAGNAQMGTQATLSIAVFSKEGGPPRAITLTGPVGSNILQYSTGAANGVADEAARKQVLPACSYVLTTTNPPQWLRINASWTNPGPIVSGTENPAGRLSFIVLDRNPMTSGTTLAVVGFEQLMRVDQYPVTLE